jgi:hypothetical protein
MFTPHSDPRRPDSETDASLDDHSFITIGDQDSFRDSRALEGQRLVSERARVDEHSESYVQNLKALRNFL